MLKFSLAMLVPLGVLIYTVQFGRWMQKKRLILGAVSAYVLAAVSLLLSGAVLWQIFT